MTAGVLSGVLQRPYPRTVTPLRAADMVEPDGGLTSKVVWRERKELPGDTVAKIEAYVVPQSGVGWIDCDWGSRIIPAPHGSKIRPEHRRILADWNGRDNASIVRDAIKVTDEWFIYCGDMAEREVAAAALAAEQPIAPTSPMGPVGVTGPSPRPPGALPPLRPITQEEVGRIQEEMRRQLQRMRDAAHPSQHEQWKLLAERYEELQRRYSGDDDKTPVIGSITQYARDMFAARGGELPSPDPGSELVEGSLPLLAGSAALGTTESASDGLSELGYDVTEPHVGR